MPRKKTPLALATVPQDARVALPIELTTSEAEFLAVEQISKRMLEQDWNEDYDAEELRANYKLTTKQFDQCVREARRNMRRAICRPQAAHQLVASTLATVIEQSMATGDMRGAADAAYKLSQATGTQASIKLKVLEQQQRMDAMRTKLLTGQASAEEIAATIVEDLMGGD